MDTSHPDLKNNIWINPGETAGNGIDDGNGYVDDTNGWDFYNNDASVYDAGDNPHGTHVAGTIAAARATMASGWRGVSWRARILPLKFLGPNGTGPTSGAVKALDYAVANGADIPNNSYGGAGFLQSFDDALKRADAAGHLFVAAVGNGGTDGLGDDNDATPQYPASYDVPNVVSVAATDKTDAPAGFSNYGAATVDLAAPGVGILSTLPGGTYGSYSGTSMAAPHVAGAATLLEADSPSLDDAGLKARLLGSVESKSGLSGKTATGGRLNAARTLGQTTTPDTSPGTQNPDKEHSPSKKNKKKGKKGGSKKGSRR